VEVTPVELEKGARLFAEFIYTYAWKFGQLTLLTISPVQDPFAPFLFLLQQPGDGLLTLFSIARVASYGN
jgi:hypothetical protein